MKKNVKLREVYSSWLKKLWLMTRLCVLMVLFALGSVSASVYSQNSKLTLKMKSSKLADVFNSIEEQTDFYFFYNRDQLDDQRIVSVDVENKKVEEVIDELFRGQDIAYKIDGRNILIEVKGASLIQSDQQKTVSGKVTDSSGQPLPGVTVVVKGTTTGTITDFDGKYTLANVPGDATLVFSFVGMKSQEVPVAGKANINVTMSEESIGIEEVVAVGYGKMKKSDLTGSLIRANVEAFREMPNINIVQSLQGSVPGLNIGQVDEAGESPSMSIRGQTTINGNTSVLVVVDGIIFNGSLSSLNPNDIESIDILKDPSSMAIYGAQSANGVVIVTTKQGKTSEKPILNYTGSYSMESPSNTCHLLNREEYIAKAADVYWERSYIAPDYKTLINNWKFSDYATDPEIVDGYDNGTNFDWWDASTQLAFTTNHDISVRGKSSNLAYYISGNYTKQQGFIVNDGFERITTRINLENEIFDWFKVGIQSSASFADNSGITPTLIDILRMNPLVLPKDEEGNFIINPTGANTTNPLVFSTANDFNKTNSLFGNFYLDIDVPFIKGLNYRLNFGNEYIYNRHYQSSEFEDGANGAAYKINNNQYCWTFDNILTYSRSYNFHRINATAVIGRKERKYESTTADGSIYSNLNLGYNNLSSAEIKTILSSAWDESSLYQMGRLNYAYKDKYLLTATLRRDGFSGFSKNNKFGLFPSFGLGWVVSDEDFMSVTWLNNLKLRFSYGTNGNLTGRYSSLAKVNVTPEYVYGDGGTTQYGKSVNSLANPNLSWEKTTGYNIGTDFSILKSRIDGTIDFYHSITNDLLFDMSLPDLTGFSSIKSNVGNIVNTGFEFIINGRIIDHRNLKWNTTINFSTNKNEIKSLVGLDANNDGVEDDLTASGLFIGEPIGAIYSYETDGIIQLGDEIPTGYLVGTYNIKDVNNDGYYGAEDRSIIGHKEPEYRFGILNEFSYKNFTLRFFINSVQGGKNGYLKKNMPNVFLGWGGNVLRNNIYREWDYWTPSNPNALWPRLDQASAIDYPIYQDRSFVRLQDVSLSYTFDKIIVDRLGIKGLKIFVSGKNLLTLTNWIGWDPEVGSGLDEGFRPVMKSMSLGVDFSF